MSTDINVLRSMMNATRNRFGAASEIARQHLADHEGYVSWSGGKDSTAVLLLAYEHDPEVPVVWFDSGCEFPENRDYIHGVAGSLGLNFHVIKAEPDAVTLLQSTGAWDHTAPTIPAGLHEKVVLEPARKARGMFPGGEMWGLRATESTARKMLLSPGKGTFRRSDGTMVCSPIWDWKEDSDVESYILSRGVELNPVYAKLRSLGATGKDLRVGLMVDGSNVQFGRFTWLRRGWPEIYADLEQRLPRIKEWV